MPDLGGLTLLGLTLILLGILLVLVPLAGRLAHELEGLPPYVLYVYRSNGFVFATSPVLIGLAVVLLLWRIFS